MRIQPNPEWLTPNLHFNRIPGSLCISKSEKGDKLYFPLREPLATMHARRHAQPRVSTKVK